MKYPFRPSANAMARTLLVGGMLFLLIFATLVTGFFHSPFQTREGRQIVQPLPFSHQHHVEGLGLDCRYCHAGVERSSFAGLPSSRTCYGCHSQVWKQADMLKPVRDSARDGRPLTWYRVNELPDYVYFNHQIHIAKGIGCVSCHGSVGSMRVITQQRTFLMKDCLSCHENPEMYVRPKSEIFNEAWENSAHPDEVRRAAYENDVHPLLSTDCSLCHR